MPKHFYLFDDVISTLTQVVTKVEYNKKGVKVTCEDKSVYIAKYAIVSVSLGVLQTDLIDFVPDLPVFLPNS